MAKLTEKNGAELIASFVNIAEPVGNIAKDDQLFQVLVDCLNKFREKHPTARNNNLVFMMTLYADVVPLLFGEKHLQDMMQILAEVEGCTAKEMLGKNGTELLGDFVRAWKEQLLPFVRSSGLTELISLFGSLRA